MTRRAQPMTRSSPAWRRMFGSKQIVFGTDYPFGLGQEGKQYVEHAVGVVQDSGLSETDLTRIFSANARGLLHLENEL